MARRRVGITSGDPRVEAAARLTGEDVFITATTLRALGRRGALNMGMHVGQASLLGAWRGVTAEGGLRGPRASGMFTVIRLATDQRLENVTGQGAPPWTWPRDELIVDVCHKGVYAFATGAIAHALAEPAGLDRGP